MPHLTQRLSKLMSSRKQVNDKKSIPQKVDAPSPVDKTQRLAAKCAEYTTRYVKSSPCHYRTPTFSTPEVDLETFIYRLLSTSDSPLLTTVYGTLALMGYIAESGLCRKASSSPHHFFLGAFLVMTNITWNTIWDDEPWVARTEGSVPLSEVEVLRDEVEDALRVAGRSQWDVLNEIINSELKTPIVSAERTHEVMHLDPKCSAYCETVFTRYTTGRTTTSVKICHFYKLKMVGGKQVPDRSDPWSSKPSHETRSSV